MAVIKHERDDVYESVHPVAAGVKCFYCGYRVQAYPLVEWWGGEVKIYFHPPCSVSFLLRFARDAHEITAEAEALREIKVL